MAMNMYQKRKERKQNKENNTEVEAKTNINWYPGHMAKTKKEISEIISQVDIVIEVIDSRIPFSSRIPNLSELTRGKSTVIVFNKYDLCDREATSKWIEYFNKKGYFTVTCDSKK